MAVFRTVAANTSESALPGTTKPPGFKGAGVRPGGAITWDWYAVFIDSDGQQMQGGSVTVQWYGVEISGPAGTPTYTTPTIGAPVASAGLSFKRKGFGAGLWPWCTISATPPVIAPKSIYVEVNGFADGTYSIGVVGVGVAASHAAMGDDAATIATRLVMDFNSAGLSAQATDWNWIVLVSANEPGVDFELELISPDDDMVQVANAPLLAAPAIVEIRTTASAAVEIDSGVVTEALAGIDFESEAAAAITTACAAGGAIRTTLRPDGGGATQTFINGPDEGGGATTYLLYSGVPSNKNWLQHICVQSDKPIVWSVQDAANITLIGPFKVDPGQYGTITAGAGGFRSFGPNTGRDLELVVSDRTAEVNVSLSVVTTDD